ncbi:MAG: hypothetical protein FWF06_07540 [Symbiobacteriaceae bacterium]|nr:hypothetical protein [Symbiobacteriaceae bacterium]
MDIAALRVAVKPFFEGWLKTDSNQMSLASFIIFICFASLVLRYWYIAVRTNQPLPKLRRIAGLDAMDESIGRATEMGRPVVYNAGISGFSAPTYAALAVLNYVARQTARFDTRLIGCFASAQVMVVAQAAIQTVYMEQGKADAFRPDDIRFLSGDQFGFASGCVGIMQRERAAAHHMFGSLAAEALILAEGGAAAGAIQISGQTNNLQQPFLIASCDYTLMVEEVYVASAYLSQDRLRIGMLSAQDIVKAIIVVVIFIGAIATTAGSTIVQDLLKVY